MVVHEHTWHITTFFILSRLNGIESCTIDITVYIIPSQMAI